MDTQHEHSMFFRTMMTGLFVGIIDTVICLAFNIFYRDMTGFVPSVFINVSSLIFAINLVLLLVGIVYYAFKKLLGKGDAAFAVFFILLTLFLTWKTELIHRFQEARLDHEFRGLLSGIVLICGLSAAGLPLLYNSRKFEEFVL
jgi:hypothetical protein